MQDASGDKPRLRPCRLAAQAHTEETRMIEMTIVNIPSDVKMLIALAVVA